MLSPTVATSPAPLEELVRRAAHAPGRLGWAVRWHLARPGKQMRARLAMHCGEALGLPTDLVRSWAVACELLHNASLVHDDLLDGDTTRRGAETVWSRFGARDAILLGDHLLNAAYAALASLATSAEQRVRLVDLATASVRDVIGGAAREREREPDLTLTGYEATVRAKTGRFLALPLEGALVLAGRDDASADARDTMAWFGIAYQIVDDLADLKGTKADREPGADLRARIASAPVVHYAQGADESARGALGEFLRDGGADDARAWRATLLASRAPADCRQHARDALASAEGALRRLPTALHAPISAAMRTLLGDQEPVR